jgi:ribose transport system permease protein
MYRIGAVAARRRERIRSGAAGIFWRAYRGENSGALILVVLIAIVVFAVLLRGTSYLSRENLFGITQQTATITVMAVPTVFLISSGEIDLSFAAVVPVAAFITAIQLESHNLIWAIAAGLLFGAAVGLVNGIITIFFKIPSFVVTLGMMGALTGAGEWITNSQSVGVSNLRFLSLFGEGYVYGIPGLLWWTLLVVIVGQVILVYTPVGRAVLATGANVSAARLSGIRTNRIKIGAFIASGVGAAFAGTLYIGQFGAASYTLANTDLLTVFASVIIGGTALTGGKGSVVGAFVGSLLLGTLNNGLIIVGLTNPEQLLARGVIIIAAVIFSARNVVRSRAPRRNAPPAPDAASAGPADAASGDPSKASTS